MLVHGGGFAASCWDRLVSLLPVPTLAVDLPARWIRTLDDAVVPADRQAAIAERVGADLTDLAAAHMVMISSPQSLADALLREG